MASRKKLSASQILSLLSEESNDDLSSDDSVSGDKEYIPTEESSSSESDLDEPTGIS